MSAVRTLVRNAGALTAARGVTALLTLAVTIYLARVLEPSAYGMLSWALAYMSYFTLVSDFGLSVYGQREVARHRGRLQELVGHILALRFVLVPFIFAAYLGLLLLLDKPPLFKAVVAVQGVGLLGTALTLEWAYLGLERMGVLAVRNVLVAVLTLAGVLLLVREPDQVVLAAAAMAGSLVLGSLWLLLTYRRDFGRPRLRFDRAAWLVMLGPVLPIAAAHALAAININMDQLMLGVLRTDQEVGWYGASYRLLLAAMIPSQILLQTFLPSISAAFGDTESMRERSRMFSTALFVVGLPVAAGGALFAPELIGLFGADYAPAVPAFSLLMGFAAVQYASIGFGTSLIAWDRQRLYMVALLGGAIANVVLNLTLIPSYGILGAAVATLSSEVVVLGCALVFYYRVVQRLYVTLFLRVAAVVGAVAAVVLAARLAVPLPFVLEAALFGALYAAGLYATGLVNVRALRAHLRRREP